MSPPIAELFYELTCFVVRRVGVTPLPKQIFVEKIDDSWSLVFNCQLTEAKHEGAELPAMTFVLDYNGFPAGIVNPYGGALIAHGKTGHVERELIALLQRDAEASAA